MKHAFIEKLNVLRLICLCSCLTLSACAVTPKNLDDNDQDENLSFVRQVAANVDDATIRASFGLSKIVTDKRTDSTHQHSLGQHVFSDLAIANGDVLQLRIHEMEDFNGLYQVTANGRLELPFSDSVNVSGLSRQQAIKVLEDELVRRDWFYKGQVKVDVSAVKLAPVQVTISGAVFNPGRVSVNNRPTAKAEETVQRVGGGYSQARDIIAGIAAAGGLRPDADVENIYVKRNNQITKLDLTPLIMGAGYTQTLQLTNGDQLYIPSTGHESISLIKPSQLTPPGLRLFMSNLIAPSLSNAQGAVGSDSTRLPYGSSLLDSAISANCVGGTHSANASRSVLFITRNYGAKQQIVISRSINQLLANSSDSRVNPYVMPNDAVACYDSKFTNFRDVARGLGELISPILLGRLL